MDSSTDADLLVLLDEKGIPREQKEIFINGFRDRMGMQFEEKYGTLAFAGPLEILGMVNDTIATYIDQYHLTGKIFPILRRESIDQEFKDRLLRYHVFQRFWQVEDEKAAILTYDINHKDGRSGKRYYALQEVGALKIFQSCYWIPEEKIDFITRKFEELVTDSRENNDNQREINYHYRVFKGYPIGSPAGLKRWKDMQLSLFMNKINTLYARTRGKKSYFAYLRVVYDSLNQEEQEVILKKAKRMRYWKHTALKELDPYSDAHLRRLRNMGIANQEIREEIQIDAYNMEGDLVKHNDVVSATLEQALEQLKNNLQSLHEDVYNFLTMIAERTRRSNERASN